MYSKLYECMIAKDGDQGERLKAVVKAFARRLCTEFKLDEDEVSILRLTSDGGSLGYVIPDKLEKVAAIPINSNRSTTAWAARNKQGRILNIINIPRSTSVFQAVRLEDITNPIQKLMVAPIISHDQLIGVIQISRKGPTLDSAGPDFVPEDLDRLVKVAKDFADILIRLDHVPA